MIDLLKPTVLKEFGAELLSCEKIGGGIAGGIIYKITLDKAPYVLAVKTTENVNLLQIESKYIKYLSSLADIKLPKIYYESYQETPNYIIMDYFDGVNCANDYLQKASKKIRLNVAEQIADNIVNLQRVKGEKYGDLLNPIYEDWHDYYHPFVLEVIKEAEVLYNDGYIKKQILQAIKNGEKHYNEIFEEPISKPTPIHGDYWAQNLIIDKNYQLIGVVDPFNCMWADSEYELFALNSVYGKKLPVLEAFISKYGVSKKFYLKNYFYFLVSETYWVTKLHHNNNKFLMWIVKNFNKQMKKFNIK